MPRKVSKILQLISGEIELKGINDQKELMVVYLYYLMGNFFLMSKGIKKYGEFVFFKDLFVYLKHHYQNDDYKDNVYRDIMEYYFMEQELLQRYIKN